MTSAFQGVAFLLAYLLGGTALAESSSDLVWQDWEMESRLRCPTHHVEQLCDECYLDILDKFDATLPKKLQRRAEKLADTARVCKDEVAGFSCEMSASMTAYEKLGLMPDFIAFGCDHVSCEEDAGCAIK
jgi:hypothetical protein